MRRSPASTVLPLLAGLAVILVWGLNFPLQKAILGQVSPVANVAVRYLIVPVCAVLLLLWRYGRHWPRLTRADGWQLARLALVFGGRSLGLQPAGSVGWSGGGGGGGSCWPPLVTASSRVSA